MIHYAFNLLRGSTRRENGLLTDQCYETPLRFFSNSMSDDLLVDPDPIMRWVETNKFSHCYTRASNVTRAEFCEMFASIPGEIQWMLYDQDQSYVVDYIVLELVFTDHREAIRFRLLRPDCLLREITCTE